MGRSNNFTGNLKGHSILYFYSDLRAFSFKKQVKSNLFPVLSDWMWYSMWYFAFISILFHLLFMQSHSQWKPSSGFSYIPHPFPSTHFLTTLLRVQQAAVNHQFHFQLESFRLLLCDFFIFKSFFKASTFSNSISQIFQTFQSLESKPPLEVQGNIKTFESKQTFAYSNICLFMNILDSIWVLSSG